MRKNFLLIIIIIFSFFCFFVFLKSLDKSNTYIPETDHGKKILSFNANSLFNNEKINSDNLFTGEKIYLLNIWSSWCAPCRNEHHLLMKLKDNSSIKIIGLNYKDNLLNAKKFINQLGNPYSEILTDQDGLISISLGAYGVPETIVIDNSKTILKKYIGSLNLNSVKEIQALAK